MITNPTNELAKLKMMELHSQMLIKEDKTMNGLSEFGIDIDTYIKVTRVYEGWIYEMSGELNQTVFVPQG